MMHNGPITAFDLTRVPEQWRDVTEQSLRASNSESFSVRRSLGGKSGAAVMLVEIKTPRHEGLGIRYVRLGLRHEGGFVGEHDRETHIPCRNISVPGMRTCRP